MERWEGKVAVVTGASSGIGRAAAEALVKHGLLVVGLARRADNIEKMAADLRHAKGKLHNRRCDVSNEADLLEAFAWVKRELGGIDVLINNAGISRFRPVINGQPEDFRQILNVNVLATAIGIREAVTSMNERDVAGHIVNMNSVVGHNVSDTVAGRSSMYIPSKYAITTLTETVRKELTAAGSKIKITSLSPGIVKTDLIGASGCPDPEQLLSTLPQLMPEHIADAIIYVLGTPPSVQICELTIRLVGE